MRPVLRPRLILSTITLLTSAQSDETENCRFDQNNRRKLGLENKRKEHQKHRGSAAETYSFNGDVIARPLSGWTAMPDHSLYIL